MDSNSDFTSSENSEVAPPAPPEQKNYPLEFTANGFEFTKLIIVNTILTILTLGIFSAWAKVRTRKYLYGHTKLNGSSFDYHADPVKILKGRLIIAAFVAAYTLGGKFAIQIPIAVGAIFALSLPWIFVRSLAFNLGNTSYRNLRFGFKRDYAGAYAAFIKGYAFAIFTCGLATPFFYYLVSRFKATNMRYGRTYFSANLQPSDFFVLFLKFIVRYVLGIAVGVFLVMIARVLPDNRPLFIGLLFLGALTIYAAIFYAFVMFQAQQFNMLFTRIHLGPVNFKPFIKPHDFVRIYLKGIFITLITLGFGLPYLWFKVMKYQAEHIYIQAQDEDFDEFAKAESETPGFLEDAAADYIDFDIGF